jgi:tRNA dimethylallyltransferase
LAGHPILAVLGPTGVGKTAVAVEVAERLGGEIVGCDALQVYRGLDAATAKPTAQQRARVTHHVVDCVDPRERFTAGRYVRMADEAIALARSRGRVPIVVGGTGLYFKALLEGLSPIPAADPEVRAFWRAEAARRPATDLHALLAGRDPEMAARLMPTDTQRIVRALEVVESTGRSLAEWQRQPGRPVLDAAETVRLLLVPERQGHGAAIDARFDAMLAAGALAEVQALLDAGLSGELPIMRAHGVPWLAQHLRGALSLEAAVAAAKRDTRQYAKRQLTWLRRNMIAWRRIDTQDQERFIATELSFVIRGVDPRQAAR